MGEVGACMIERALSAYLGQLLAWFPVVSVTGPRQSGKSTLVKARIQWGSCAIGPTI